MTYFDKRGLATSAVDSHAVAKFDVALDDMLEYRASTAASIQETIAADGNWAMPDVLFAGALLLMGTNVVRQQIDAQIAKLDALEWDALPEREGLHVKAVKAWASGDLVEASRFWETIIIDHPTDLLALRSLHFQNFWMGRASYMRNLVASAFESWTEAVPGYGFVLGMSAFGFEECGDYGRAERLGREAVARNPDDLWSVHAVAHVLEMQGRLAEGQTWLGSSANRWSDRGPFVSHLWWHAALFALERGQFDKVLEFYDTYVKPGEKYVSTDMMNAPSLLARLEFQGVDVGARWEKLADRSDQWLENHVVPFTDAHTMFPFARTGRDDAGERFLASLDRLVRESKGYAAEVAQPYLVPIAKAIRAYYRGDYGQSIELLMPIRSLLQPIGGSHAQRDLFHQLLTEAAIKAGRWKLARNLLDERIALRPDNPLNHQKRSAVQEVLGMASRASH